MKQTQDSQGGLICPTEKNFTGHDCYHVTELASNVLTSMNIIAALVATLICFRVARALGRRKEMLIGAFLYVIGGIVSGLAVGTWMVFIGQLLYGMGVGFSMHAAPAYIAEISPSALRGLLVSMKEAFIVLGILLGFLVGNILHDEKSGWRYMLACIPASVGMLQLIGVYISPSSPRWLLVSGRIEEARASLNRFRVADHDSEDELFQMQCAVEAEEDSDVTISELFQGKQEGPRNRHGRSALQQLTGRPSVLTMRRLCSNMPVWIKFSLQPVFVGTAKLFSLIAAFSVDRFGRKYFLRWDNNHACITDCFEHRVYEPYCS